MLAALTAMTSSHDTSKSNMIEVVKVITASSVNSHSKQASLRFVLIIMMTIPFWTPKAYLIAKLTTFLEERVIYARESITRCCASTIRDDDVILTFGFSPLIRQVTCTLK